MWRRRTEKLLKWSTEVAVVILVIHLSKFSSVKLILLKIYQFPICDWIQLICICVPTTHFLKPHFKWVICRVFWEKEIFSSESKFSYEMYVIIILDYLFYNLRYSLSKIEIHTFFQLMKFFKKNLALRFLDSFDSDIVFLDISMYTSLQSFNKTMMWYSPITDHGVHCSRWWLLLWACDGALEELVNISSCESFKCSKVYITISILIK